MEKITFISRKPMTSKTTGKPFTSLSLKVESKGDRFLSGFGNKGNDNWAIGDTVDILIEEKGQYLNFTMAESKKGEELANNMKIDNVYSVVLNIQTMIMELCKKNGVSTGYEDIQLARNSFNSRTVPVSNGYSSRGADGENPIRKSDVDFSPDITEDDIGF